MKFLLIVAASFAAICGFMKAFFLRRIELSARSTCDEKPSPPSTANPHDTMCGLRAPSHPAFGSMSVNNTSESVAAIYKHIRTIVEDHDSSMEEGGEHDNCWGFSAVHGRKLTPRKKIFLFIIDALRTDMLLIHDDPADPTYNQFKYVHQLLIRNASQTQLFTFAADSPTTTSQRLKGITTGTFPTFIDFSGNFNVNNNVVEDNIIDQLSSSGRRMVFLGDDTWRSLFPSQFDVCQPFASFDTVNLHGVDDSIKEHMWKHFDSSSSSSQADWDVFVVHFLGMDHIGHTHNAFHEHMASKIREMDALLERVVEALPPDSLLLLFGDHGMTDEGEHGGDSEDELGAGMFVYSTSELYPCLNPNTGEALTTGCEDGFLKKSWDAEQKAFVFEKTAAQLARQPRRVEQTDFAVTLSAIADLPVPYSSIGALIPELTASQQPEDGDGGDRGFLHSLFLNAMQVRRFTDEYRNANGGSAFRSRQEELDIDQLLLAALATHSELSASSCPAAAIRSYFEYLEGVKGSMRTNWITFDLTGMMVAAYLLLLLFITTSCLLAAQVGSVTDALASLAREEPVSLAYCSLSLLFACTYPLGVFSDNMIRAEPVLVATYVALSTLLIALHHCVSKTALPRTKMESAPICLLVLVLLALLMSVLRTSSDEVFVAQLTERAPRVLHYLLLLAALHRSLTSSLKKSDFLWYFLVIFITTESAENNFIVLAAALLLALHLRATEGVGAGHSSPLPLLDACAGVNALAISRCVYFSTGHSFNFSSLKVSVAFTGTNTFNFLYGGIMLFINTFGSEIIALLALRSHCQRRDDDNKNKNKNDNNNNSKHHPAIVACLWFKLYVATSSVLCNLVLRKHLMVFAVFAPKLIFELSFFVGSSFAILFLCL